MEQEQIKELTAEIINVSVFMYQNKEQKAYEKFEMMLTSLQEVCMQLIQKTQENQNLQEMKLDIIAVNTLKQLVDCYKWKDILGLADCLNYEMLELINIYAQLAG